MATKKKPARNAPASPAQPGTTAKDPVRATLDDVVAVLGAMIDGDKVDRVADDENLAEKVHRIRLHRESLPGPEKKE